VFEGERLVEAGGLGVVDEEEDAVGCEGFAGFFELGFPVDLTGGFEFVAVEGTFGVGGLDETAEGGCLIGPPTAGGLGLLEVEVLDFLVDAGADEFADGDGFRKDVEGEGVGGVAGGGLVVNGDGGHGVLLDGRCL